MNVNGRKIIVKIINTNRFCRVNSKRVLGSRFSIPIPIDPKTGPERGIVGKKCVCHMIQPHNDICRMAAVHIDCDTLSRCSNQFTFYQRCLGTFKWLAIKAAIKRINAKLHLHFPNASAVLNVADEICASWWLTFCKQDKMRR